MRIPLDRQSAVPLYQQIKEHLYQSILSGGLAAGDRLPSSRQLAQDLGVNRITVDTAYAGLEADGLIESRLGSGTYVLALPGFPAAPPAEPRGLPPWQQRLAKPEKEVNGDSLLERLRMGEKREWIDFSSGVGDARLFPDNEFRKALQRVMRQHGGDALTYGDAAGYLPLRRTISHILASQGLLIAPEQILITSGSQQAMTLIAQTLLQPGDTVIVEKPTYSYALILFRSHHVNIVSVAVDEQGMRLDELEKHLQTTVPRLIYTIPNFHNPTGVCLNSHRRRQLITLASRYDVPLLEDDFVGDLRYDGQAQPALKSLDPGGQVIYTSSFSKMLMPGLRIGFLAAEGPAFERLVECKRLHDLGTSNLFQRALDTYISVGRYHSHLRQCCQAYRQRRDAMAAAIRRHLPQGVRFSLPAGGLFIWLGLPPGWDAEELLRAAARQGVLFAPGCDFFDYAEEGRGYLRLDFASLNASEIEEGMQRLGTLMRRGAANLNVLYENQSKA